MHKVHAFNFVEVVKLSHCCGSATIGLQRHKVREKTYFERTDRSLLSCLLCAALYVLESYQVEFRNAAVRFSILCGR